MLHFNVYIKLKELRKIYLKFHTALRHSLDPDSDIRLDPDPTDCLMEMDKNRTYFANTVYLLPVI